MTEGVFILIPEVEKLLCMRMRCAGRLIFCDGFVSAMLGQRHCGPAYQGDSWVIVHGTRATKKNQLAMRVVKSLCQAGYHVRLQIVGFPFFLYRECTPTWTLKDRNMEACFHAHARRRNASFTSGDIFFRIFVPFFTLNLS